MSINNYSNSTFSVPAHGNVVQQVFNASGSVHLDQFHDTNKNHNHDNITRDGVYNPTLDISIETDDTANDNVNLFDCQDNFILHLNQDQDSVELTNDEGFTTNNGHPKHSTERETNQEKISVYEIPLSLRKPFKIPYQTNGSLKTNPSTMPPTTPKTGQSMVSYGRVFQLTTTTLVDTTTAETSKETQDNTQQESIGDHTSILKENTFDLARTTTHHADFGNLIVQTYKNQTETQEHIRTATTHTTPLQMDLNNNAIQTKNYLIGNLKPVTQKVTDHRTTLKSQHLVTDNTTLQRPTELTEPNSVSIHKMALKPTSTLDTTKETPKKTPTFQETPAIDRMQTKMPSGPYQNLLPTNAAFTPALQKTTLPSFYTNPEMNLFTNKSGNSSTEVAPPTQNDNALNANVLPNNLFLITPTTRTDNVNITSDINYPHTNNKGKAFKSTGKLYISRFIDASIKPNNDSKIILPADLELLRPLIMSQPEVLAPYISELGNTNLTHSKVINKKKESFLQLTTQNKIPRSLRIKVELTTSPSLSSNPKFLQIKEELQNATNDYIKTGIKLMTEWAQEHILLLIQERCHALLTKALQILDGIALYNAAVIFRPAWFSSSQNFNTLLLLKLYLSNEFIDVQEIASFLETPLDTILLLSAKILTNHGSEETALDAINKITLVNINLSHEDEFTFLSETLICFDQILRVTTIDLWKAYEEKIKQFSAVISLQSRMAAFETLDATAQTASAILRAAEAHADSQATTLQANLRLTNLEKNVRKHEQKTNELTKILKQNENKHTHSKTRRVIQDKHHMVDLTKDDDESSTHPNKLFKHQQKDINKNKKRKQIDTDPSLNPFYLKGKIKTVQWKEPEPPQPVEKPTGEQAAPTTTLPFFASAPRPIPPPAPSLINPFKEQGTSPFTSQRGPCIRNTTNVHCPFQSVTTHNGKFHHNKPIKPKRDKNPIKKRQR